MNLLRAFIAIEIPQEIKKAIAAETACLQTGTGRAVRWVTAENTHLTLKFLGEVSPTNVDMLSQTLQAECSQLPQFGITVSGMGCFPNVRRPRVIWIGLNAPADLNKLQHKIEAATARLGYPIEEKPFSPHLTIGRVREQASADDLKRLHDLLDTVSIGTLGAFTARAVYLFKSDLQPSGPVYSHLFSAGLGS
jgi:2'-5' RNA ligase